MVCSRWPTVSRSRWRSRPMAAPSSSGRTPFWSTACARPVDAVQKIIPIAQINDNQARALLPGLSTGGLSSPRYDKFTIPAIAAPENRWAGTNRSGWNNPEFDGLWQAYGTTLDQRQRIQQV